MTAVIRPIRAAGQDVEISACEHGAHLLSWTTAGVERLWLSPVSRCGEATAIRGGVPILFPQFGTFGKLQKHGFARTTDWRPAHIPQDDPEIATLAFDLHDSPHTRAIWPHPFHARVEVRATASDLVLSLRITNLDEYDARFTAGLHTYLRIADPLAWVSGLSGASAWDGRDTVDPVFDQPVGDHLLATDERDLAVHDPADPVVLHDDALGDLSITAEGFPDRVVWNPGRGQRLPDVPPGLEANFVCIEPVALTPVTLHAGQTWTGSQRIAVL